MSKIIEYHLPSQLTSIGANAYQGCSNLKSLNIPENLQTIGDYAFAGCYQISSIIDKRLTAQTVSTNTFGNTTGTGTNAYTGYQTKGNNVLSTYFAATGYDENTWDDPLQNLEKCGFIQQYIDPENVVYYTITFNVGNGSITETSKQIAKNRKIGELLEPICPEATPYFGGWYTAPNGEGDKITKDYIVNSDITLYALYGSTPFASYEVILNNQWQASTIANPDSSLYDGVYESFSNYNVGNKAAVMYIKITGYTSFTIYIRSNAESSCDYTVAFNLDTYTPSNPLTSNPSSSTSGVKAHTSSKQNSGTTIGSYTKVEYTGIDGGEHYICVAYRKDSSVNNGTDRGYVLIEQPPKLITINFDLNGGTLFSGSLIATGIQGKNFDESICPIVNGPSSTPLFVGWNDSVDGSGTTYNSSTILPNQTYITLYAQYIAEEPEDPNKDIYLCFTAEEANSGITMISESSNPTVYLETSTTCKAGSWTDFVINETAIYLTNVGDKVYFRAKQNNTQFIRESFAMIGKIAASGNINTLLKADGSVLDLTGRDYCYSKIFNGCTSLTQAPELPATTLANGCYASMFEGCTSLTQAPALPATTLAMECYESMFSGCESLTQAPELPATTLADGCYYWMFRDCVSLTSAPELPATTLANYCYQSMFSCCESLTQAPELPATTLTEQCYYSMFDSCTSLTQAPELPAMNLADYCYADMFYYCEALVQAPELPATTLASGCYERMFLNCISLTSAPELPATTLAAYCYSYMFSGCESLTQAPNLPATTLGDWCYEGMFYDCSKLNSINVNFSTWAQNLDSTLVTIDWVYNVASSGTFTCPASLPEEFGTSKIPSGWTIAHPQPDEPEVDYLCFTAEQANSTIRMYSEVELGYTEITVYLETSTTCEDGSWSDFTVDSTTITLANVGDKVYFRAKQDNQSFSDEGCWNCFRMTGKIAASGNLNTLLKADGSVLDLTGRDYCYANMFQGCSSLTQAPELPATTLANSCYQNMFYRCTSLTQAPVLPATTLASDCYRNIFCYCSELNNINVNFSAWNPTNATTSWVTDVAASGTFTCPTALPETYGTSYIPSGWTIAHPQPDEPEVDYLCFTAEQANSTIKMTKTGSPPTVYLETSTTCEDGSWSDFTVDSTTITLANVGDKVYFRAKQDNLRFATDYSNNNYFVMTGKIAASGNINTLLKADGSVLDLTGRDYCYANMFQGCSSLTQAPELPATTLANSCYQNMFWNCTSPFDFSTKSSSEISMLNTNYIIFGRGLQTLQIICSDGTITIITPSSGNVGGGDD